MSLSLNESPVFELEVEGNGEGELANGNGLAILTFKLVLSFRSIDHVNHAHTRKNTRFFVYFTAKSFVYIKSCIFYSVFV